MNFESITLALVWIFFAFAFGLFAKTLRLPPLVGFLAAGFLLNALGVNNGEVLDKLADLGITLLLFMVGLKLNIGTLARPQVWAVAALHSAVIVGLFGMLFYLLTLLGIGTLSLSQSLLIAFALSFSSTVLVVKTLEENGQTNALHGRLAVGILIMQDLAAVVYLAASTGVMPSYWALLLLLLVPLRSVLLRVLNRVGHGELLVLYGFLLAIGGAQLFQLFDLKGDLGALLLGVLIANHAKADELAKTMLSFKDLFLLGFFLSIGLSGELTTQSVLVGIALVPLVLVKAGLFFVLLTRFKLRARTALITATNLTNFSEFGLIVLAIAVSSGWLQEQWLLVMAVALSCSYVIAVYLNSIVNRVYTRHRANLMKYQQPQRLNDEQMINIDHAQVLVIGMGRVGSGAYDKLRDSYGDGVLGIDIDAITATHQRTQGRRVLVGDPSDYDFWDRVQATHTVDLVMLALPKATMHLQIIKQLKTIGFAGKIASTVRFADEAQPLIQAGADTVFNIYNEAGAGFATHVIGEG